MFKNVLVGVDGSPNGRDAIALASQLLDADGELSLAHVRASAVKEAREDCRKLLDDERREADVDAALLDIVSATPGRGLHQQAEQQGADLLVVGSCGHAAFGRTMLGDHTRSALNGASCAVAIASRGYAQRPQPIARVGVGYDGSPESNAALDLARELAGSTGATVHAMEVVALVVYAYSGFVPAVFQETEGELLEKAKGRIEELGGVEAHAACGLTGEELARFGDDVDILVVGSRGYGPIRRLVLGSTANYLERHARCPLLVVPRDDE